MEHSLCAKPSEAAKKGAPGPSHEKAAAQGSRPPTCGRGRAVITVVAGCSESTEDGRFTRKTLRWTTFLSGVGGSKSLWLRTAALGSHCLVSSSGSDTVQLCDVGTRYLTFLGLSFCISFYICTTGEYNYSGGS